MVVDAEGVAGYLLATADTEGFEAWAERSWWPLLREQYPLGQESHPADAWLVERVRGTGLGGRLMSRAMEQLAARGVPGVHLGVGVDNANAIAFYLHLGFTIHGEQAEALWMTRSLLGEVSGPA